MNQFESARNIAHVLLQKYGRKNVTNEIINKEVENIFLMSGFDSLNKDDLISQLEVDFDVYSKEATMLVAEDIKPWLYDEKAGISFELWNRYRIYLNQKDASFPIDSLDDITDKILDKCVNPKLKGRWDRRGLVVGNVQSGKTANYTGLINKATDAGYKLIIVIAGIHNSLRAQTQNRIDDGFIGRDSSDFILRQRNIKTGVGHIHADTEIYSYTSSDSKGDFNRAVATRINVPIGGKSPTVLVIKKNKSILENLILWLHQFAKETEDGEKKIFNVPLLLIDDEADNASVNSGTELDVRTINRLIRTLLNLFNQNTFIGYTATPYANIFIPSSWSDELETNVKDLRLKVGEDLFPRDFIVNIPPPSNYIGATQVFGFENTETGEEFEGLDIVRFAEDQEPYFPLRLNARNKDDLPEDVPYSIKTAIRSFILTCAIRRLRGQKRKHNSMLVHVALYVKWIDRVALLVSEIVRDYQLQIRSGQGTLIDELEDLFKTDYAPTTENVKENIQYRDFKIICPTWEEVKRELIEAASKIQVRAVHGTKNTRNLEFHNIEEIDYNAYENGMSVIAVGGNRLARGITLEGLSVSYYLRTTRLYDSLMQMGRWFGYKPGYVDLCRLFTTEQLVNWYRHITLATEEMRTDFDEMSANNRKPIDYRLKVRTHSGMLSITATGKMREHEKIQVGFSGKITQTYDLIKEPRTINSNFTLLKSLINLLDKPKERLTKDRKRNGLIWENVNSERIMEFLSGFISDQPNIRPELFVSYIQKQNNKNLLKKWTIALILNSAQDSTKYMFDIKGEKVHIGLPRRTNTRKGGHRYFTLSKNNILDPKDRQLDLSIKNEDANSKKAKKERAESGKSLLVIYPLDWNSDDDLPIDLPLVGWGLVFPEIENEEKVEFAARPMVDDAEETQIDDDENNDD